MQKLRHLENPKQGLDYVGVFRDVAKGLAHEPGMDGGGSSELNGGFFFRGARNHIDLIVARLPDGGRHLPQPIDDFLLDLLDHHVVAEVDFPDINRAELIAPGRTFG